MYHLVTGVTSDVGVPSTYLVFLIYERFTFLATYIWWCSFSFVVEVPKNGSPSTYRPPPRTQEVVIRGQVVKLKYCFTCKIFRPPRASHCSLCDNCVGKYSQCIPCHAEFISGNIAIYLSFTSFSVDRSQQWCWLSAWGPNASTHWFRWWLGAARQQCWSTSLLPYSVRHQVTVS